MGRHCVINSCNNRKGQPDATVHAFPNSKTRPSIRERWIEKAIGNLSNPSDLHLDNFGVCSKHFLPEDYAVYYADKKCQLKPLAIPSILLGINPQSDIDMEQGSEKTYIRPKLKFNAKLKPNSDKNLNMEQELRIVSQKLKTCEEKLQLKRTTIKMLHQKVARAEENLAKSEEKIKLKDGLIRTLLTPGQIRFLTGDYKQQVHWGEEDISKALALYSVSGKAYNFIRDVWKYPLPSDRTLRRWLKKIDVRPGELIQPVLRLMEIELNSADIMSRACAIAIDEVGIDNKYCYDVGADKILGGHDNVCVVSVRSLFGNWKQIIRYDWENSLSKDQLVDTIKGLHEIGLNVYAVVTDMGTKNQGLWSDLKVGKLKKGSINRTWFLHPITCDRIWIFPDFPHLLKLLRNHLLDSGIHLPDGSVLDKQLIVDLIKEQRKCEFKLNPKLTNKNVYLRGKQRQNVATAFQLFSNKTAKAILRLLSGRTSEADFIQLINDFSDLMNSRLTGGSNKYKVPFGSSFEAQMELLDKVFKTFTEITIGKRQKNSFAPFQKGILMGIMSLRGLFEDMKIKVGCTYILTSKLNQDYLENIFSQIRGLGGFSNNPTALEFRHRIKKLLVTRTLAAPTTASVQQEVEGPEMISSNLLSALVGSNESSIPVEIMITDVMENRLASMDWSIDVTDLDVSKFTTENFCEEGGIEYVAGYVSKKFLYDYPEFSKFGAREGSREPFWVGSLSNNTLTEPALVWHATFKKFDEVFREIHPPRSCNKKPGIVLFLTELLKTNFPNIPEEVIKYFAKIRTCIRVQHLNSKMQDEKSLRQEKSRLAFLAANKPTCVENEFEDCIQEPSIDDLNLVDDLVENLSSN